MNKELGFGAFIFAIIVMVVGVVMKGWALSILWSWFMVPTFGLPALSVVPAIGLALVINYLTHQTTNSAEEDKPAWHLLVKGTALAVLQPLFALGFGAIVHAFM